jgi:hypothetical protein
MALTADQRAMLQLLLEREQSYDDLASLLDASRDEVQRRARAALTELAGSDPDSEVGLTDYLFGEADPIGRADAVRHLQADPEALRLAEELSAKLLVVAPDAKLPELPQPKGKRRGRRRPAGEAATAPAASAGEPREPASGRLAGITPRQSRLFAALAAGAVLVIVIVLAVTGAFGGDDDEASPTTTSASGNGTGEETGDVQTEELTRVTLQPEGNSDASGQAIFGLASNDQPFLDLQLQGLEEPPENQTYVVWFLLAEDRGYPLAPVTPNPGGVVDDRFAIPQVVLPIAVRTQSIDIALVDNEALASDLQQALEGNDVLLRYQGESVLRGDIPRTEQQGGGEGG